MRYTGTLFIYVNMCLKCCFSFNFFAKIKNWRRPKTIFGVQSWSLPHSQVRGEIVTHLVKILKLYQLVEEEASKSSLFFLSANQSPSLSSSLRSRSRGHRIRVSTWKRQGRRNSILAKENLENFGVKEPRFSECLKENT